MKWPQHLDYIEAIQHPTFCFAEPALRQATPVCDRFGVPRAASGNFACVFQVVNGGNYWAVRCFTRAVPNIRRRYAMLTQHLSAVHVSSLVDFSYLEQGIRIRGQWHPLVKMEWVEGNTLPGYVEAHINQPQALRRLVRAWSDVAKDLRCHRIAHGDLQHGNILVMPDGRIRLVDYDAMYIPAFRREPSPELGHPNWQHPRRTERDNDENLDSFASMVLTTSLEALAVDSNLWRFHNGENLLFTREDFEAPRKSELFGLLNRFRDRNVQRLAEKLESLCLGRPSRPRFSLPRVLAASNRLNSDQLPEKRATLATATSSAPEGTSTHSWVPARCLPKLYALWGSVAAVVHARMASQNRATRPIGELEPSLPPDRPSIPWYLAELPAEPSPAPLPPYHRLRQRMARDRNFAVLVWACAVCGGLDLITLTVWWFRR